MIEFLFGWLLKGKMNLSILDVFVFLAEMFVAAVIVHLVYSLIAKMKKRKMK